MKKSDRYSTRILGDIIVMITLMVSLVLSVFAVVAKTNNRTPSIFGFSLAVVQSGSMEASGFYIGDEVLLLRNTKSIEVGDIVAYYYCYDPANPEPNIYMDSSLSYDKTRMPVIFHQVVEKAADDKGVNWYKAKGTSNSSVDSIWIRQDFLMGKYTSEYGFMRSILSAFNNQTVMICLALIPAGILLMILLFQLISYAEFISFEKKLLSGELSVHDESFKKGKIVARGMKKSDKIKLYLESVEDERDAVGTLLWGNAEKARSKVFEIDKQ